MELARLALLVGDKDASFGWLEEAYKRTRPGPAQPLLCRELGGRRTLGSPVSGFGSPHWPAAV